MDNIKNEIETALKPLNEKLENLISNYDPPTSPPEKTPDELEAEKAELEKAAAEKEEAENNKIIESIAKQKNESEKKVNFD